MEEITVLARDLRVQLSDYIDTAMSGTAVRVTRHRRAAVVMVSDEWYELASDLIAKREADTAAMAKAAEEFSR